MGQHVSTAHLNNMEKNCTYSSETRKVCLTIKVKKKSADVLQLCPLILSSFLALLLRGLFRMVLQE